MKCTNKRKLDQFVVIPTFGIAWGDKGTHLYFAWLRFRLGIILENWQKSNSKKGGRKDA